jgi:predicted GH43/DUF377 family glycosyl hydrolase
LNVRRSSIVISPDPKRVILRPLNPVGSERQLRIIARVLALDEAEVSRLLDEVWHEFAGRHRHLLDYFLFRFNTVRYLLPTDGPLSAERELLIGAYFTQEYSLEAAALFNPSIVPHPDQTDVPQGSLRFILSLRSTGEGHISSITFRSGLLDAAGQIELEPPPRFATVPREIRHALDKRLFVRRLEELNIIHAAADSIVSVLPDSFSVDQLAQAISSLKRHPHHRATEYDRVLSRMFLLAQSNYEVTYTDQQPLSERVLFPTSPSESHGMEDARFVKFAREDGSAYYIATYTAYSGQDVVPQMIETNDFLTFRISTLNGPEVQNKGMALFPRKIRGQYCMISRQDAENLYVMSSENLHFWHSRQALMKPTHAWEFVQIGNCGSPIETEEGWLVLSHGVGPMRKYTLGAFLLDLDDPSRVIGRMKEPFLSPNDSEREGYVPNVLYSCGALVHNQTLVLPYAMSDSACSFASVPLAEILAEIRSTRS